MQGNTIHRGLNLLLYLLLCAMAGTGVLLAFRLPPGSRGGAGWSVWGWTRHDWGDLHGWLGLAFLALVLVHLVLHWAWLRKIAAAKGVWRLWAGLAVGALIVSLGFLLPVQSAKEQRLHRGRAWHEPAARVTP